MTLARLLAAPHTTAAAVACLTASAGFAGVALWTHQRLSALGPICGLSRPTAFFLHCPACPAALGLALLGLALASREQGRIFQRASRTHR